MSTRLEMVGALSVGAALVLLAGLTTLLLLPFIALSAATGWMMRTVRGW